MIRILAEGKGIDRIGQGINNQARESLMPQRKLAGSASCMRLGFGKSTRRIGGAGCGIRSHYPWRRVVRKSRMPCCTSSVRLAMDSATAIISPED